MCQNSVKDKEYKITMSDPLFMLFLITDFPFFNRLEWHGGVGTPLFVLLSYFHINHVDAA